MRFTKPFDGKRRLKTKFLILPVAIGLETRWLEKSTILQEYCNDKRIHGYGKWNNLKFIDNEK